MANRSVMLILSTLEPGMYEYMGLHFGVVDQAKEL